MMTNTQGFETTITVLQSAISYWDELGLHAIDHCFQEATRSDVDDVKLPAEFGEDEAAIGAAKAKRIT